MHYVKWLAVGTALLAGGWFLQHQYLGDDIKTNPEKTAQTDIQNEAALLSGSWIYNAGDCDSKLLLDSVYEINFKDNADNKRAGTVNTTSQDFTIEFATDKDQDLVTKSNRAIANCDDIDTPNATPFIARYSPYPLNKTFLYYRDAELLVQVDGDDIFIFRRLSRLREIKALLNSSDNETT